MRYSAVTSSGFLSSEGTPIADTLIVLRRVNTLDLAEFHFHTEVFPCEFNGFDDGKIGITLTATRSADLTDGTKSGGSHSV